MEHATPYLSTKNLSVGYKHKDREDRLFEDLNLSLAAGELICFMGPNGAGKTSLLRTLAGLQRPLSGSVQIMDAEQKPGAHLVAVVLTDPLGTLNLTVGELVTYGRYPYLGWNINLSDKDKHIISTAIEQVHLEPLLHRKVYELSDGQLQMVMIARALAQDTPLILMDEPTAHLDLNNRLEIMNVLRELSRQTQKAILVATHELDLALQTADRIWLTGKSRDILTGLPEDLVLNGTFDNIFQFKGFDLRTGKVLHQAYRNTRIQLMGTGSVFLWTRNALERNGFTVTTESQEVSVSIAEDAGVVRWTLKKMKSPGESEADSIENLINSLNKRLR